MAELTDAQRRRVEQYLSLDVDDLMSLIPPYLQGNEQYAYAPQGMVSAGWEHFEDLKSAITPLLCDKWSLCKKIKSAQYNDALTLINAMADVISVHSGFVPPFLISTIVFKMGVRQLCKCPE
jgi:hypothetical protein